MASTTSPMSWSVSMVLVLRLITSNVPQMANVFHEELTVMVKSIVKTVQMSRTVSVTLINFIVSIPTVSHVKINFVTAFKTVFLARTRSIASRTVHIQSFVTAYAFRLVKSAIKSRIAQVVRTSSTVLIRPRQRTVKKVLSFIVQTRVFLPLGAAMEMLIVTMVVMNKTASNVLRILSIVKTEHAFNM